MLKKIKKMSLLLLHLLLYTAEKGELEAIGHADFYPNYGVRQPGCKNKRMLRKEVFVKLFR